MSLPLRGLALLASLVSLCVPVSSQDPEALFHHAYFLEKERGHLQEALDLYRRAAQAREASAALQGEAGARAAALAEDLASLDLARLMPPEAILYAELSQPGEALVKVLEQLGLAGSFEEAARREGFAVRPEVVTSLLGIRALALAVTSLPAGGQPPRGVVVLHAGELEALRGLIESALLAGGVPEDPIEGALAWTVAGQVHVAVSRRLVIAAQERDEVAAVLRRMAGGGEPSLATNPALRVHLEKRRGDPFFCCLNAAPVRPLVKQLLQARAAGDPRAALISAVLDPESLETLVARVAVGEDGLALEAELTLAGGHRNLVFNLLRGAPIDPATLDRVPSGAAAFLAGALNQRGPAIAPLEENAGGAPVVTAMDLGRELFANLAGYALYVLPGGGPVPRAALVLSSNDPARTNALLGLVLGLANTLSGAGSMEPEEDEIAGAPTRVFRIPPGLSLFVTTHESTLIVSPSEDLIEHAVRARAGGRSVLHDPALAGELGRTGKDATFLLCAHAGRLLEVARPYLPPDAGRELAPWAPALERTVVALRAEHSATRLAFGLALHGLPRIDGLVAELLARARGQGGRRASPARGSTAAALVPR